MSTLSITLANGKTLDCQKGDLLFPYFGNWSASVIIAEATDAPTGKCTLTCFGKTFQGTIIDTRSGQSEGVFYCMVIGGNGGLSKDVTPLAHTNQITARIPLESLLSSVSETISTSSSTDLLSKIIPKWNRFGGSASIELSRLIDSLGGVWRVASDGSIFVGTDLFRQADNFDYVVIQKNPVHGSVTLALQTLGVLPGQRFPTSTYTEISNRKIGACQYKIMDTGSIANIWFLEENGMYTDNLHEGLESFIKEVMRGVDYHIAYPCRVISQRADGTLDIEPDDTKIPPMSSVPVRCFIPGAKYKVTENSRGNLIFENANPQKPAFTLYEMGTGGKKIARVDDEVNVGELKFTAVANGVLNGTYTNGKGTVITFTLGSPIPLLGKITTGWPNLEVGPEM